MQMTPSEDVMCHRQSTMKADAMRKGPSGVLGPDDQDSMPFPAKVKMLKIQEMKEL